MIDDSVLTALLALSFLLVTSFNYLIYAGVIV